MTETLSVLLTGGTGLVGRTVLASPLAEHHDVVAPPRTAMDLEDGPAVTDALRRHRPDIVIHAAGHVGGIQANIASPAAFLNTNLTIGLNLVRAMQRLGAGQFLNLGSSCMYPTDAPNPLSERSLFRGPLERTNEGYAIAKVTIARATRWLDAQSADLAARTLVPCNLYGPFDHYHPSRSHMVAAAIAKVHEAKSSGAETVAIWGDGHSRREFLFAPDLAEAIGFAIDHFFDLPPETNIGTGVEAQVNEYYALIAETIGYTGSFVHDATKPTGMRRKVLDVSIMNRLGWSASTPLRDGLRCTYEHFVEHNSGDAIEASP